MRTVMLGMWALAAATMGQSPAIADVMFDVEVQVTDLATEVTGFSVRCHTCAGECGESESPAIPQIDVGRAGHVFPPGTPHNFSGTLTVVAKPTGRPGTPTNYLCALDLGEGLIPS